MRSRLSRTAVSGMPDGDEIARASARIHVHFDVDQVRFDSKDSRTAGPEKGH